MTIREYAADHGVSVQTIYNRLRGDGISPKSIITGKNLTDDGIRMLNGYHLGTAGAAAGTAEAEKPETDPDPDQADSSKISPDCITALKHDIEVLQQDNRRLKKEVDMLQGLLADARSDRDRWAAAAENAEVLARQAQTLHMASIQAMKKTGLISRIMAKVTKGHSSDQSTYSDAP